MVVDPKFRGLRTQPPATDLTRFGFQRHENLNGYVFTVPGLANTDKNSCKWNIATYVSIYSLTIYVNLTMALLYVSLYTGSF